ncbi:MAG: heme exporter protein CcmD [Rhodospirillales bacterium]
MDLNAFLDMGGYGAFVWPSYGLSALVLIAVLWQSHARLKRSGAELENLRERDREAAP